MREETLLALLYMNAYSAGFLWDVEKTFNGELTPMDPEVCTTQNITFNCTLLDDPRINYSIGFAVSNESTSGVQVAVDNAHITSVNATMSQFTIYNISLKKRTSDAYSYVSCYYWKEFGDMDGTLKLGETTSAHITPIPIVVRAFKCVVINYGPMRCTWEFGKDYGIHLPELLFEWRRPSYSASWNDCPSKDSIQEGYCHWDSTRQGFYKNGIIDFKLTLKQTCGESVTSEFQLDTSKIVKPNPVVDLTSVPINSTCILVSWSSRNSQPHNPKEHKVTVYRKWENKTTEDRFTTTSEGDENVLHNMSVCGFHPHTYYTFSVSIKPAGQYSGDFSDEREVTARTYSAKPSASPEVIEGGYSWQSRECQENNQRVVCTFWKQIKDQDKNGRMKSIQVTFTPKNAPKDVNTAYWAEDTKYGCMWGLRCNEAYTFSIKAENRNGTSDTASTIEISAVTSELVRPQVIVEWANSSDEDVYISWSYPEALITRGFTVAWCRNNNGDCDRTYAVNWEKIPSSTLEAIIQIDSSYAARDMLYGVSAITDLGSSGLDWQDCVYQKDAEPRRRPQNVIVSEGSEDNTLIVTWDKLTCTPDEPYIDKYSIQYTNLKVGSQKTKEVRALAEARLVLVDLKEDQPYEVTVRSITKDGRKGPESQPQTGTPVNRSLNSEAIVGITMAALVCAIFAGVGCFCVIRRCKNKAKKAIKEAGNITIPDAGGLELNTSIARRDSKDSGYDMTSSPDIYQDSAKMNKSVFFRPDDYHLVTEWKGSKEGMTNDITKLDPLSLLGSFSDKPCISTNAKELSDTLLDSSRKANCVLEIPKPSAFIKYSESEISCDEKATTESVKDKSTNYVLAHKLSSINSKHQVDKQNGHSKTSSAPENNLEKDIKTSVKDIVKPCHKLEDNPISQITDLNNKKHEKNTSRDTQYKPRQNEKPKTEFKPLSSTSPAYTELPEYISIQNSDYVTTCGRQPSSTSVSGTGSVRNISAKFPCKNKVAQITTLNTDSLSLSRHQANKQAPDCSISYVTSVVDPSSNNTKSLSIGNATADQTLCCVSKTTDAVQNNTLSQGNISVDSTFNPEAMCRTSLVHIHSTSVQNKNHSSPREAGMPVHVNESCIPSYIVLQSGVEQRECSQSYSTVGKTNISPVPDTHYNNGYSPSITVSVPSRVVGSYVPHCVFENDSETTGKYDLSATAAVNRNIETSFVLPNTDFCTLTPTRYQTDSENVNRTLKQKDIPSVLRKSPEHPINSVPDTNLHFNLDNKHPMSLSYRESVSSQDCVDESFANVPIKEAYDVLEDTYASEQAESQDDGYLGHSAMKLISGGFNVISDRAPKSDENSYIPANTIEDRAQCFAVDGYVPHRDVENISYKANQEDSLVAVSNNKNTKYVLSSLNTDNGLLTNRMIQSEVLNHDDNLRCNAITTGMSRCLERYNCPSSDTYVSFNQGEIQPHFAEYKEDSHSPDYVDESFADVPLKRTSEIPVKGNTNKSAESQEDSYFGNFDLENVNGLVNVLRDKEPQSEHYLDSSGVESQCTPLTDDSCIGHTSIQAGTRRLTEPQKMKQKEMKKTTVFLQSPQEDVDYLNGSSVLLTQASGKNALGSGVANPGFCYREITTAFDIAHRNANDKKNEMLSAAEYESGFDCSDQSAEIERKQSDIGNGYISCNVAMSMQP